MILASENLNFKTRNIKVVENFFPEKILVKRHYILDKIKQTTNSLMDAGGPLIPEDDKKKIPSVNVKLIKILQCLFQTKNCVKFCFKNIF